jgi:thiaminase
MAVDKNTKINDDPEIRAIFANLEKEIEEKLRNFWNEKQRFVINNLNNLIKNNQPSISPPNVANNVTKNQPVKSLPWFSNGIKGFVRKLWYGDSNKNPDWSGVNESVLIIEYASAKEELESILNESEIFSPDEIKTLTKSLMSSIIRAAFNTKKIVSKNVNRFKNEDPNDELINITPAASNSGKKIKVRTNNSRKFKKKTSLLDQPEEPNVASNDREEKPIINSIKPEEPNVVSNDREEKPTIGSIEPEEKSDIRPLTEPDGRKNKYSKKSTPKYLDNLNQYFNSKKLAEKTHEAIKNTLSNIASYKPQEDLTSSEKEQLEREIINYKNHLVDFGIEFTSQNKIADTVSNAVKLYQLLAEYDSDDEDEKISSDISYYQGYYDFFITKNTLRKIKEVINALEQQNSADVKESKFKNKNLINEYFNAEIKNKHKYLKEALSSQNTRDVLNNTIKIRQEKNILKKVEIIKSFL